ncbi:hypothetical protein Leryth_019142 [Lithospermum erythrorhizon]|nr:hypothetical protein Leryth_019142 [Lithospermum erythrorhizon]
MSKGRRRAHLLHLGDKLFAIGGNTDGKHTSLIEVFEQGVWTPICTENPPDIDPYFLVSAAIEDANSILIGSKAVYLALLTDSSDIRISKLIDLGEGILCFIYAGWEWHRSIDVHGVEHEFCDHHCVTFEINYDSLSQIETNMSFPFPRIELETSVISHYKCYAPSRAPDELGPAFALDIHIPHKKVLV